MRMRALVGSSSHIHIHGFECGGLRIISGQMSSMLLTQATNNIFFPLQVNREYFSVDPERSN